MEISSLHRTKAEAERRGPLVSVVVTTFNHAPYIGEALESVLAQTHEPVEIIVVDDGSTDRTPEELRRFEGRVSTVFQPNQGVAASRNTGIGRARGELIALLDGDDLWEPEKLSVQVEAARDHPDAGLIVVDGIEFDGDRVIKPTLFLGDLAEALAQMSGAIVTGRFYRQLLRGSFIGTTSQVMIPSRVLAEIGLSDTSFRAASDYDLYLRIAARYELTFVRQALTRYRYLSTSASGPRALRFRWGAEEVRVLEKQAVEGPPEERDVIRRELEWRRFRSAQRAYFYGRRTGRAWARRFLLGYLLRHPRSVHAALYLVALCIPRGLMRVVGPLGRALFPDLERDRLS